MDFLLAVVPPTMSRYRLVARPLGHGGKNDRTFGVQDAIDNHWMPALVDSHAQLVSAIVERDPVSAGLVMDGMFDRLRAIAAKTGISVDPWPRP